MLNKKVVAIKQNKVNINPDIRDERNIFGSELDESNFREIENRDPWLKGLLRESLKGQVDSEGNRFIKDVPGKGITTEEMFSVNKDEQKDDLKAVELLYRTIESTSLREATELIALLNEVLARKKSSYVFSVMVTRNSMNGNMEIMLVLLAGGNKVIPLLVLKNIQKL